MSRKPKRIFTITSQLRIVFVFYYIQNVAHIKILYIIRSLNIDLEKNIF